MELTPHQQKYLAWELTRCRSASDEEKLTGVLSEAQVDLNPHQVEAALFAFRSPLSMGAILADEVGLGKTIEAALVISQQWAEQKRNILIITPATLRKQWSLELDEKFFLPSIILERKNFHSILSKTYSNPFENRGKIVICSYQFAMKQAQHIKNVQWDLVVMDEAHKLRNVYKNGNKTAIVLKNTLQPFKKLLLTATPLQNDLKELYGLVSIIDNNFFGNVQSFACQYNKVALREGATYTELQNRLRPIIHRTLRSNVQEYVKYTKRSPLVQEYIPNESETELYHKITEYLRREHSYGMPRAQKSLITLVLHKLLASSSFAVAGTLATIIQRLETIISEHSDNCEFEAAIEENFDLLKEYEDEWTDENNEEILEEDEFEREYSLEDIEAIKEEIIELKEFHRLALSIVTNSKGDCLLKALEIAFGDKHRKKASKKALIFTESTRTQNYIKELLESNGYKGKIVLFNGNNTDSESVAIYKNWLELNANSQRVSGSLTADKRQALVDYFKNEAEIMIATEAASEGINLQFCSLVVNYDLPWNPQRVEQRIGRCHRYGQTEDVVVVNFINKENRADQRVYELLDQKFKLFKGVFGASDEVLGIAENSLDFERRILDIYQRCRTPEQIDEAFDAIQQEMKDHISETLEQTHTSLLDNFDEAVIEKLRMCKNTQDENVSTFQKMLWRLTIGIITDYVDIIDTKKHIFKLLKTPSPNLAVGTGLYQLGRNVVNAYNYRQSHPLANYVIEKSLAATAPGQEITFNYSAHPIKISALRANIGNKGWLTARLVRFTSMNEVEDYVLFAAVRDDGVVMEDDFTRRLLSVDAEVTHPFAGAPKSDMFKLLEKKRDALFESLEHRNSDFIAAEIEKIERWAEDNRIELQQVLKEFDKLIEDKSGEFMKERNMKKKLDLQREKDILTNKRDDAWRDYDKNCAELRERKNSLIEKLYAIADQQTKITDEFTVRWIIK